MEKIIYTYPSEQENVLNWLSYDKKREWLLVHDARNFFVDFITLEGEHIKRFDYQKELGIERAFKAIDRHPTLPLIAIAGREKWGIYNYDTNKVVFEHPGEIRIPGISFNPEGTEVWVNEPDAGKITVYDTTHYKIKATIPIQADLSMPIKWHPSGDWFSFVAIEAGGCDVMFGNPKTYQLVKPLEMIASTTCYNMTGLTFSPDGKYVLFTDEAVYVYAFPSLEQQYVINNEGVVVQNWKSKLHPESYYVSTIITIEKKNITCNIKSGLLSLDILETGDHVLHELISVGVTHYFLGSIFENQLITSNKDGEIFLIDPTEWIEEALADTEIEN